MSVNFCARALSERALAQLHEDEQLTVLLAAEHDAVDFDRVTYMARWEETAKRRSLPPRILARAEQLARDHERHWSRLAALGLAATDVGQTIELERAFLGLTWGWSSSAILRQIFDDAGGAPIGDDVGYGPARLFSNHEVGAMQEAIAAIDLPTFAAAYHDGHKAFMTQLGQSYSVAGEWEDLRPAITPCSASCHISVRPPSAVARFSRGSSKLPRTHDEEDDNEEEEPGDEEDDNEEAGARRAAASYDRRAGS